MSKSVLLGVTSDSGWVSLVNFLLFFGLGGASVFLFFSEESLSNYEKWMLPIGGTVLIGLGVFIIFSPPSVVRVQGPTVQKSTRMFWWSKPRVEAWDVRKFKFVRIRGTLTEAGTDIDVCLVANGDLEIPFTGNIGLERARQLAANADVVLHIPVKSDFD